MNGYTTWFESEGEGWASGDYVTPVASQPKSLYLSASTTIWIAYSTNKISIVCDQCGTLTTSQYGSLTSDIVGNPQTDVVMIDI